MNKKRGLHRGAGLHARLTVVAVASLCFVTIAPAQAETVCAVIPASGSDVGSNVADLLELRLAQVEGITLVSRAEFQAILTEQMLSAAFSPEGTRSRLELGRLIKADLLVFLRERPGRGKQEDNKVIELAVAETRRGLRLAVDLGIWNPQQPETPCKAFVSSVLRARSLATRTDLKVFAVSPLESQDLSLQYASQRRGFARLIEESLIHVPGVVVVELSEARALAQEVAISGQQVSRDLPYYVFGSYRTTGGADSRAVNITLELRHGEQELSRIVRQDLPPPRVGGALQDMIAELLAKVADRNTTAKAMKLESSILVERGDLFRAMGEWDQALPMYESALLLDPKDPLAHMRIFDGRIELMSEGSPGRSLRSYHRVDYPARMRHADSALDHLEILLLERLYYEAARKRGETRTRTGSDKVSFPDIMNRLRFFNGQFYIGSDYNRRNDPQGAYAAYQRSADRLAGILVRTLADEKTRVALGLRSMRSLVGAIAYASRKQSRSGNDQAAWQTIDRLMKLLDDQKDTRLIVYGVAILVNSCGAGEFEAFLDGLERSGSERLSVAARFGRVFASIEDEVTLRKAHAELKELAEANGLAKEADRLLRSADTRLRELESLKRWLAEERGASKPEASTLVPKLKPVQLTASTLSARNQPSRIDNWLVCGDDLEVVSTDMGLFRVEDGGQLRPIWVFSKRWRGEFSLTWDGRYVWAATWWLGPVYVLDPQAGRLARFDQSDMPPGVGRPQGVLAPVEPGRTCFFGHYSPESPISRNYATLLDVEPAADGKAVKHAETFFESRHAKRSKDQAAPTSRPPAWALTVPRKNAGEAPLIVVGGSWGHPLLLDPEAKTVTELRVKWPRNSSMTQHDGLYYVGSGKVSFSGQHSSLYRTDDLGKAPKLIVDFGKRPFEGHTYAGYSPYYRSMIVFENHVHLLASQYDFKGRAPIWVAVSLTTWDTRLLVDRFPDDFAQDRQQDLRVSPRYGLLLISNGKLFRAELPPAETWPRMEAKVFPENLEPKNAADPAH